MNNEEIKKELLAAYKRGYEEALNACVRNGGEACPLCGSDCNERDELEKAEREIERLRASPVMWAVCDPSGEVIYAALFKTRCVEYMDNEYRYGHSAAKNWTVRPVFLHSTAARAAQGEQGDNT